VFTTELTARRVRKPSIAGGIAVVALVGALAGIGFAAIPGQDGTLRACYAKTNGILLGIPHHKGDLRLVDEGEACQRTRRS
jgi:hypothetical protein